MCEVFVKMPAIYIQCNKVMLETSVVGCKNDLTCWLMIHNENLGLAMQIFKITAAPQLERTCEKDCETK